MAVIEVTVTQAFPMYEPPEIPVPQGVTASNTIVFLEALRNNRKTGTGLHSLDLSQYVVGRHSIVNKSIFDSFYMSQRGARAVMQHVTQILAMWDSSQKIRSYDVVSQSLSIIQTLIGKLAKPGLNTLAMQQAATYTARRNITTNQTFIPRSHSKIYKMNPNFNAIAPTVLSGPNGSPEYTF